MLDPDPDSAQTSSKSGFVRSALLFPLCHRLWIWIQTARLLRWKSFSKYWMNLPICRQTIYYIKAALLLPDCWRMRRSESFLSCIIRQFEHTFWRWDDWVGESISNHITSGSFALIQSLHINSIIINIFRSQSICIVECKDFLVFRCKREKEDLRRLNISVIQWKTIWKISFRLRFDEKELSGDVMVCIKFIFTSLWHSRRMYYHGKDMKLIFFDMSFQKYTFGVEGKNRYRGKGLMNCNRVKYFASI